LVNAIEDISKREESRKILFILTDASGYIPEHMKHVQKMADTLGVTLIAIGIHSVDAIDCFVNSSAVNDISELAGASFNTLLKTVQRRRTA
jgi:cobalamin biosynthesis protein CobT